MKNGEDRKFQIIVHLINGEKLECSIPVGREEIQSTYQVLGEKGGKIKIPTAPNTMQFLPATSVLRIEAVGPWEQ
jgi:hypothetical protein